MSVQRGEGSEDGEGGRAELGVPGRGQRSWDLKQEALWSQESDPIPGAVR